ncbi:MAG: tetratricopeptide repeat protein [Acidobacteriia bacterium]|nr:tetratricopeptide repeat protein [Terriglobia bacterium]
MNGDAAIALRERIWELLRDRGQAAVETALHLSSDLPVPGEIPDDLTAQCIFDIGFELERLGQDQQAMAQYRRVTRYRTAQPKYPASAWFRLGVCLRRRGDYGQAVDGYRKSLALAAGLTHLETLAHFYLGEMLEAAEEYDQAVRSYSIALDGLPHPDIREPQLKLAYGRCAWRTGEKAAAVSALREVARAADDPASAEAWKWLAEIAEAGRDFAAASEAYREIMASPHAEPSLRAAAAYRVESAAKAMRKSGSAF